jgi:hypothetical protein
MLVGKKIFRPFFICPEKNFHTAPPSPARQQFLEKKKFEQGII